MKPNVEAQENTRVNYDLTAGVGLSAANSFSLKC